MADKPLMTADTPIDVHLPHASPHWRKNAEWRDKLAHQATRKALDIPDDDMPTIITANKTGISTAGAIGIAAMAGLPPTIAASVLGAMLFFGGDDKPDHSGPADSEYEVIHYDADGNIIPVPHISQLKKD